MAHETHYTADKYIVERENFSGITPRVIAQDSCAAILFSNVGAGVRRDVEEACGRVALMPSRDAIVPRTEPWHTPFGNADDPKKI